MSETAAFISPRTTSYLPALENPDTGTGHSDDKSGLRSVGEKVCLPTQCYSTIGECWASVGCVTNADPFLAMLDNSPLP